MTLSELIAKLERIRAKHGDLEVLTPDGEYISWSALGRVKVEALYAMYPDEWHRYFEGAHQSQAGKWVEATPMQKVVLE